jgi:hypothetical protein
MIKILFSIVCMALWIPITAAKDTYVAQNTAGADSGSDCADAHSAAWFNSSSNWGSGSTQIGPGTIVHLCGTFTGSVNAILLTTQGNGAAGNPITIKFETGAVLTSPAWGQSGAIHVTNNYITVDGGTNGTIKNTLNGTPGGACLGGACSVRQAFTAAVVVDGNYGIVKNLTVTHMCVHTFQVNDNFFYQPCTGIQVNGSNGLVTQNAIDNAATGIGGSNGAEISYNTITYCNHAITFGIASGIWTGIVIHNNDISQLWTWDEPDNAYHHNGIMLFSTGGVISGVQIYYNYLHGLWSNDSIYHDTHVTAWIFLDTNGIENSIPNAMIFRNVFEADASSPYNYPSNGFVTVGGCSIPTGCTPTNSTLYANNTVVGRGMCFQIRDVSSAPLSFNNLCATTAGASLLGSSNNYPGANIDYNIYAGTPTSNSFYVPSGNVNSWAQWSASPYSLDVNGRNPTLAAVAFTSNYHLGAGSVAIGRAANLRSRYCAAIPALCVGAPSTFGVGGANDGVAVTQSLTANWDAGAYPTGTAAAGPNAPVGLVAIVN